MRGGEEEIKDMSRNPAHRKPTWPVFPIILGVVGLAIITWGVMSLRLTTPPQDPAVCSPLTVDVNPSSVEDFVPLITRSDPEHRALYPEHPELGDNIGTLTLPTLDLSWPIFEGTTEEQLQLGVGHFVGSVLPGVQDNSVLSGHRNTVFGRLGELSPKDQILVSTSAGVFTYEVREFRIVEKTDRSVIVPTDTAVLTLTTCYPFVSLVATTQAFIVSSDLVTSALAPKR